MCCCHEPNINGEVGYRWQPSDRPGVYPTMAPTTDEHILYDEPGRCGGQDSHCHHYRVIGAATGAQFPSLLVRHGGGSERFRLSNGGAVLRALAQLDSNGRYWLLNALYHAAADARRDAQALEADRWRQAAADGRIKRRKVRGRNAFRVEVLPVLREVTA